MFTAAVCDDEKEITGQISRLLAARCPGCETVCYSLGDALLADKRSFDIIFLDVQMKGRDGIETARELRRQGDDALIIFISGIKEYVFSAFDVSAFNYLLKPLDEEKFFEVLERALSEITRKQSSEKQRLFIKTKGKSITVRTDDILYLENDMRRIAVHTVNGIITFYGAMSRTEEKLGDNFFRCHRGYLVNMEHIYEYDSENICLTNGERIYMAKEKYQEFVKCYMRFLRGKGASYV